MKGILPQESKEKFDKHFGVSASKIRMIYDWFPNFMNRFMTTGDAEHSGVLAEATNPGINNTIHDLVMDDRKFELVSCMDIWSERVHNIVLQHLNMKNLPAR